MAGAATAQAERTRQRLISTIRALVTTVEIGEARGQGHAQRVTDYCTAIATQMNVGIDELRRLRVAALIHDSGKVLLRLTSPGATPEQIRDQHVQTAEKMFTGIEGFEQMMTAVKLQHERADGSGFPSR
jgi:HD-GYP domain-containing protein (c-di-GMP phosphodiesterase class II)